MSKYSSPVVASRRLAAKQSILVSPASRRWIAASLTLLAMTACPFASHSAVSFLGGRKGVSFGSDGAAGTGKTDLDFSCPQPGWKSVADCGTAGVFGDVKCTLASTSTGFYERCKTTPEYCTEQGYSSSTPSCASPTVTDSIETCSENSGYKKWTCVCPGGYSSGTTSCADGQTKQTCTDAGGTKGQCVGTACSSGYSTSASCGSGYTTSSQSSNTACKKCDANACSGYSLTSCPANGSCTTCQSGSTTKYSLSSCSSGYSVSGNSCVQNAPAKTCGAHPDSLKPNNTHACDVCGGPGFHMEDPNDIRSSNGQVCVKYPLDCGYNCTRGWDIWFMENPGYDHPIWCHIAQQTCS